MFILEEPYVSDLLAATVAALGLPVLDTPMARRRLTGPYRAPLSSDAEFAAAASRPGARLYSNSENAIGWIAEHLVGDRPSAPHRAVQGQGRVPRARRRSLSRLPLLRAEPRASCATSTRHAFARPSSSSRRSASSAWASTWSTRAEAWPAAVAEIEREVEQFAAIYPDQVLGLDRFVVEEVIEGEEFAVDAYFDADGRPVLVDVYAHLFASADDVSDRVYYTNAETIERLGPPAMAFLAEVGRRAPSHRLPGPRRAAHRRGRQRRADRDQPDALRRLVRDRHRALRVRHEPVPLLPARRAPGLDRASPRRAPGAPPRSSSPTCRARVDLAAIESVDYEAFAARFSRVLELRPTDFNRYPVFAFTFVEVPSDDLSELHAVLGCGPARASADAVGPDRRAACCLARQHLAIRYPWGYSQTAIHDPPRREGASHGRDHHQRRRRRRLQLKRQRRSVLGRSVRVASTRSGSARLD